MNYAIKYDHKLNKYIVYDKSTKKVESKHSTRLQAERRLAALAILEEDES